MSIKYIASNSNGKDSLWMLLELIRRNYPLDLVLFYDTSKEFGAIYDTWEKVKVILNEHNIPYDVIEPPYSFDYGFSEKPVKGRDGSQKQGMSWCGNLCRWASRLKINEITKYYNKNFPNDVIVEYIGIASDERERVKAPVRNQRFIKKYPLIEWGYTEADCFVGCYKKGFKWKEPNTDVELYEILSRVSCFCCRNKSLVELKQMYIHLPYYWDKLKEMQAKTDLPMKQAGTVFELEERFKREMENK